MLCHYAKLKITVGLDINNNFNFSENTDINTDTNNIKNENNLIYVFKNKKINNKVSIRALSTAPKIKNSILKNEIHHVKNLANEDKGPKELNNNNIYSGTWNCIEHNNKKNIITNFQNKLIFPFAFYKKSNNIEEESNNIMDNTKKMLIYEDTEDIVELISDYLTPISDLNNIITYYNNLKNIQNFQDVYVDEKKMNDKHDSLFFSAFNITLLLEIDNQDSFQENKLLNIFETSVFKCLYMGFVFQCFSFAYLDGVQNFIRYRPFAILFGFIISKLGMEMVINPYNVFSFIETLNKNKDTQLKTKILNILNSILRFFSVLSLVLNFSYFIIILGMDFHRKSVFVSFRTQYVLQSNFQKNTGVVSKLPIEYLQTLQSS
jgi:hypothetical protein